MTAPQIAYRQWAGAAELRQGLLDGAALSHDGVVIAEPVGVRAFDDPMSERPPRDYEYAVWTSPDVEVGFGAVDVVPSWNASTPRGTWIEVAVEVASGADRATYSVGRWAQTADDVQRASVPADSDGIASVDFDVLKAAAGRVFDAWRLQVTLLRAVGSDATPTLALAGAVVSATDGDRGDSPSASPPSGHAVDLDVPPYSQALHRDEYPQFSGGGEAWCSPASTSMVMAYHGVGPTEADYAWVESACDEPWIDHAAASMYDPAFRGAGNWSFNVAYAAGFGLTAFVTRLGGLDDAEAFVAAGLPLVASVTFAEDELTGAGYGTAGHLLVVRGFTEAGDVVVNDPASHQIASNDEVRAVYRRDEFERVWLEGSGGIVYVLHPPGHGLPQRPADRPARW